MADDPNPALRAELNDALVVLAPQIRGLHDLAAVSVSADLLGAINHQITIRERRREFILAVLHTLDLVVEARAGLEADGYPTLGSAVIEPALFSELQGQDSDLTSAVAVFGQQATISISPTPTFTSQSAPGAPGP